MTARAPLDAVIARRPGENGYVLVSVLWLLGLLALAIATMSVFTVNSMSVVVTASDRVAAGAVTRAAIETAVFEIMRTRPEDLPRGAAEARTTSGIARVTWRGENGRIDINLAPAALLRNMFARVSREPETWTNLVLRKRGGAGAGAANEPAPGEQTSRAGADDSKAQGEGPAGEISAPFRHVRELAVVGLPDDLVTRILPWITVHGGSARIDPRLASREILSLVPDMTEARLRRLEELLVSRETDPAAWQREAGASAGYLMFERGPTIRLRVETTLDNGFKSVASLVIILYGDDDEPYRVLSWSDAFSGRNTALIAGEDP